MRHELKFAPGVPDSEFSIHFAQGMVDRMGVSFFKYGLVKEAYPEKLDAVGSAFMRILRYLGPARFINATNAALAAIPASEGSPHRREHGNTEYLMDAANFLMIEFMHPRHPDAHFRSTDSDESPGRMSTGGANVGNESNTTARDNIRLGGSKMSTKGGFYQREGD